MKRLFLVGISWSTRNNSGCLNIMVTTENQGFRWSDVVNSQNKAEKELFEKFHEPAAAVVMSVSELENDE